MVQIGDATVEQVSAVGALTGMLVDVDRTISSLLAVKEGLLAVGSRIAADIAGSGGGDDGDDLDGDRAEIAARMVAAEFAAALRVSDRTVQRRMVEAEDKIDRFPRVWQAQGAGRITAAHARAIMDAGDHLSSARDRDAYAEQMVGFAEGQAVGRVGRMARRLAERMQSRSIDDRHRDAQRERRVWVADAPDGMAKLGLFGPAALVHGVFDRLTALAKNVQDGTAGADAAEDDSAAPGGYPGEGFGLRPDGTAGEPGPAPRRDGRTMDQLRCDIALDLLLAGIPTGHGVGDPARDLGAVRGQVSVTIPIFTLLGLDSTPAELNGCTPIDAATARRLAAVAPGWDRVFTHPETGEVLAVDRYRPTAQMRRMLHVRDQRCRFPGCGIPAIDCDIDHTQDAALGGPTGIDNLGDVCRRHHVLKHATPWHVEQLGGGVLAWTSPTGRVYLDTPPAPNTLTVHSDHPPAGGSPPGSTGPTGSSPPLGVTDDPAPF